MNLRLPAKLEPGAGLRAVLLSLARQAQRDVEKVADGPERRIHSLRTGMKKYRSLLRLTQGVLKKLVRKALCERIRTLKDGLAGSRDDLVIFEAVRRVLGREGVLRLGLKTPHGKCKAAAPEALVLAAHELVVLTETLDMEALDGESLKRHARRSLRKAQRAMKAAIHSEEAHGFHIWRKHVKNVWYQSSALGGLGKKIEALRSPAQKLSGVLGNEHDLTIVLGTVGNLTPADREALEDARKRLRTSALALAAKMRA